MSPVLALQLAAFAIVLAAFPYQLFHLDRYTFAKELVLLVAALVATLGCLAAARRLTVFMVDLLLGAFLAVSLLSALLATNRWLSFRAFGVSLAGAAMFWCARSIARAGRARPLLVVLAVAVVLGALTGLAQAYGLVTTSLASLTRAPGGTFGNRNFMAHLVTIGLPLLLLVSMEARTRRGFTLGAAGFALSAAALVLSRSRAAWLGAAACGIFLAVEGLWVGRLWDDRELRRRVLLLAGVAVGSLALAILLPNRLNWRSASPYLESLAGVANYREGSGAGRLIQYGNTLRMAADDPVLGVGPGNWPVHYPRYKSPGDPSFDADDIIPTNPWPSSDWMGMLAERGVPGALLLGLVGVSLGLGAWARVRRGTRHTPALTDLTIVATLLAVAVVGSFDAVLLLPVPTLFAWTIVGALASTARPVHEIPITPLVRRRLVLAVVLVGGLLVLRSAAQTVAMAVFASADRRAVQEFAARIDPGSYRIRMLLAQGWRAAGICARARPHAEAAAALFPHYPAPRRLLRACGTRRAR
ncbi:MAG TPA: O-antigen ligase family protein [Gemmatimonadales bacterium]|nr:O-antigen ligase family protein [Gemmatimonadales bacterium]